MNSLRIRATILAGLGLGLVAAGVARLPTVLDVGAQAGAPDATVRYVDDDGACAGQSPCYTTLQAAVDAAASGDTVSVAPGDYAEDVVAVDKALTFVGPGAGSPTAPPDPAAVAVWRPAAGSQGPALVVDAAGGSLDGTSVTGFRVVSATWGIVVTGRAPGGTTPVPGRPAGGSATTVHGATVADNLFERVGGSAGAAVWIVRADGASLLRNVADGGLVVDDSVGTRVVGNRVIASPGHGVVVRRGDRSLLADNVVSGTALAGVVLSAGPEGGRATVRGGSINAVGRPGRDAAGLAAVGYTQGLTLTGVTLAKSAGPGAAITDTDHLVVTSCLFADNAEGLRVVEKTQPGGRSLTVGDALGAGNRFVGNAGGHLVLVNASGSGVSSSDVHARYNDWSTAYLGRAEAGIRHRPDDTRLGLVTYAPMIRVPASLSLAVEPDRLVAGSSQVARVTARPVDATGSPAAADAIVALAAAVGQIDRPGEVAEAEGSAVQRGPPGAWSTVQDGAFGSASGGRYVRAASPGAWLAWTYRDAGLLRFGQNVAAAPSFDVTVDRGSPEHVTGAGPTKDWEDWPFSGGAGEHRVTVTLTTGTLAVDRLASGGLTENGSLTATLAAGGAVGVDRVTAMAYGPRQPVTATTTVALVPGPASVVTVTAAASTVPVGGLTTTLTVRAEDAYGHPVADGTQATLTATLGSVEPAMVSLIGGTGSAVFRSGNDTGVAELSGQVGGEVARVDIDVIPGPPALVTVTAAKTAITANGHDTLRVAADVTDRFGHPVGDGTPVTFATSLGDVSPTAATTSNGVAATTLSAGAEAGQAVVQASAGSAEGQLAVGLRAPDLRIVKSVEPISVVVPGERVTFTLAYANQGPGKVYDATIRENLPEGLVNPIIATTGPSLARLPGPELAWVAASLGAGETGYITVALRVDPHRPWGQNETIENGASLSAPEAAEARPDDNAATAQAVVVPGAAYTVTLTGVSSLPVGGVTGTLRANITDRFGNAAADGTAVFFSADRGTVTPEVGHTVGGRAETVLASGTRAGLVTVRALTVENRGGAARVRFVPGPAHDLTLVATQPGLPVGGATSVVTATLTDAFANPLAGAPMSFVTDLGRVTPEKGVVGPAGSMTTVLRSGVRTGTAHVSAGSGGLTRTLGVPFTAGEAASLDVTLSPGGLVLNGSATARAQLADAYGNPVPDRVVAFHADLGVVEPTEATTDAEGTARTRLRATAAGVGLLRVTSGSLADTVAYRVRPNRAYLPFAEDSGRGGASAGMSALYPLRLARTEHSTGPMRQDAGAINVVVPRFLTAGGTGAAVAAQVLGPDGGSVPDGTAVTFSATLGLRLEPVSARTMNGVATVVAVPGTEAGFARIDASAGSDRGTAVLWVRPGPAAEVVSVEAQPAGIAPGAMSLVTAAVNDAWGNAAEGDTVRWSADLGSVDDAETRLDAGRTAVWFTSDGTEGVAHVALQAGEARGEAYIPVDRLWAERNHVVFLPRALSDAARTCEDLLVNSDFGADRDADGVPDNWRLEPGAEALTPISAEGLGRGEAIRLALSDDGAPVRLYQDRTAPADLVRGTLRLWLKGSAGAHLRAAVWSMVDVAGNPTRLPLIVENIATADAWTLQVLPLPVPPVGATTVELSPRGAAGDHVDIARSSLEVCR